MPTRKTKRRGGRPKGPVKERMTIYLRPRTATALRREARKRWSTISDVADTALRRVLKLDAR